MTIQTDRLREIANPVYVPCVGQDEAIAIATELLACREERESQRFLLSGMRALLVRCGRAVGGVMVDDVSTDFLGYVPAEVERVVARLHEERDAARAEAEKLRSRLRETNQTIVECIGASGPDTSEDAAKRAVDEIEKLRGILDDTESESGLAALQVDEAVEEYPTLPDFVKHIVEERVAYGEEADALSREVESLRAELAAVKRQRDELVKACSAKDDLLACYRIGKRPSEALFKRLDKAKEVLDNIAAEQPKPEVQP